VRIDLHGELDLATSADLSALIDRVTAEPGQTVVVVLRALTFCDCGRTEGSGTSAPQAPRPRRHTDPLTPAATDPTTFDSHQRRSPAHIRPKLAGRARSRPGR
jgi:hypothetical protein